MTTTATPNLTADPAEIILAMSFELGISQWKIAFSTGLGQPPRICTIAARDLTALADEIARAKARFSLPAHREW